MKEVILYVYGYEFYLDKGLFVTTEPDRLSESGFKGRIIAVETDLQFSLSEDLKAGDVVADVDGKAWLVVELCDSAMKSFQ